MGPWCGQMGLGGWLGTGALWVVVVAAAVWALTRLFPGDVRAGGQGARAVLDGRLARGEIDPDAYRLIREELDAQVPARRVSEPPGPERAPGA